MAPDDLEGITLEQFIKLMVKLNYLTESEDSKVLNGEMECVHQAWKMLSHQESSPLQRGKIISLRNAIIFFIAIENLFIESMSFSE
jgi:hypothetical protein